jgi:hypothetical protein
LLFLFCGCSCQEERREKDRVQKEAIGMGFRFRRLTLGSSDATVRTASWCAIRGFRCQVDTGRAGSTGPGGEVTHSCAPSRRAVHCLLTVCTGYHSPSTNEHARCIWDLYSTRTIAL